MLLDTHGECGHHDDLKYFTLTLVGLLRNSNQYQTVPSQKGLLQGS